jgi:hypothetical protein
MLLLANFERHAGLRVILFLADEAEEMSFVHFEGRDFGIMLDV